MSEEKRQNVNGEEHGSDDKHIENFEVEIRTTDSDNTARVSHSSSAVTKLYGNNDAIEIDPSDIIIVEDLSHESLGQSSSETLDCTVIYEFPSDYEIENVSDLSQACVDNKDSIFYNKRPPISDDNEYRTVVQIHENQKKNMISTKAMKKDAAYITSAEGTSSETERKRKVSTSSLQNKRYKEVHSLSKPVIQLPSQNIEDIVQVKHLDYAFDEFANVEDNAKDSSSSDNLESNSSSETVKVSKDRDSDEFADVEDNAKDSSSSENCESGSTSNTVKKALKDLDSGTQSRKGSKTESRDAGKSSQINDEFGSKSQSSQNNKTVDKTAEKTLFTSSILGETIPQIIFPGEFNKKFELPMTTIFEVPESETDQQISQTIKSVLNPLKMKTSVIKRKDKCNICNAKLGLCAIRCRCGGYYCARHRYDKEHNCTFDYKSMGAEEIRKNNPRITAEKVRKL